MSEPKSHATRIDLPADVRGGAIALLNQQLADTFDLYSQTKQGHWNVKGMQFFQLHELFDKLAGELDDFVDLLAERVTALGGTVLGRRGSPPRPHDCPSTPLTPLAAGSTSRRWRPGSRHSPRRRGRRSIPPPSAATPTPRTCSRRCPGASTRASGSSMPTSRNDPLLQMIYRGLPFKTGQAARNKDPPSPSPRTMR